MDGQMDNMKTVYPPANTGGNPTPSQTRGGGGG